MTIEDVLVARVEQERKTFGTSITEQIVCSPRWVPPDTFHEQLGAPLWPRLQQIYVDTYCKNPSVIVGRGAIGWGKSFLITWLGNNKMWELSLLDDPATVFGLAADTEIIGIVVSVSGGKAKNTGVYKYSMQLAKKAEKVAPWMGIRYHSKFISFNDKVFLYAGHSQESSVAGDNVFIGFIEEANFLSEAARRKYEDQSVTHAQILYRAIERRIQSRFISHPGMIAMVGHELYPQDFLSEYCKQIEDPDEACIFNFKTYETRPTDTFKNMSTFRVYVGSDSMRAKMLDDNEKVNDMENVEDVPIVYQNSFKKDLYGCLREILGVSTIDAARLWCTRSALIDTAAQRDNPWPESIRASDLKRITKSLIQALKDTVSQEFSYAAALDLSRSSDSSGIAIGHSEIPDFMHSENETIVIDAGTVIIPDVAKDIMIHDVESLISELVVNFPITKFAADQFQSDAIVQRIGELGVESEWISVDRTPIHYRTFISRLYDSLIALVKNRILLTELKRLVVDPVTGKVDHPPNGSKDLADPVCRIIAMLVGKSAPIIVPRQSQIPTVMSKRDEIERMEREERGGLIPLRKKGMSLWASDDF